MNCTFCGRKMYKAGTYRKTIDHFYPQHLDKQHLNRAWNRFEVCRRCNHIKAHHVPEAFIKKLQKRLLTLNPDSEYATDYQDIIINVKLLIEKLKGYFEIKDLL